MKVSRIVDRFINQVTPNVHRKRKAALSASVLSLVEGSNATVTSIGRGIAGNAYEKHKIKRADRLCSNAHLQAEKTTIYHQVIHRFAHSSQSPVILVDWSDADDRQQHFLLRATLILEGRGITLYQEVHTVKTKDKPNAHVRFLNQLRRFFPADIKPIIVTDAGFRCPWFKAVKSIGWDFIGRVRNRTNYRLEGEKKWFPVKKLYDYAENRPILVGGATLAKANPLAVNFVLFSKKAKGRHHKTRKGTVAQWTNSRLTAKREKEPWLLATSIPSSHTLARRIVKIYRARMQIESTFRDTKSPHYGLGFSVNGTRQRERLAILLLISTLASIILIEIGIIGNLLHLHRRYQANTIKSRSVLSFHYLGLRLAREKINVSLAHLEAAKTHMENLIKQYDNDRFAT